LIILNVIDGEYFAFGVPTQQSQILVSLIDEMLVDFAHYAGAITLLR